MAKDIKTPNSASEDGPKEISKEDLEAVQGGKTLNLKAIGEDQARATILRTASESHAVGAASRKGL